MYSHPEHTFPVAGSTNLTELLGRLSPKLHPGRYAFATVPLGRTLPPRGVAVCELREAEGTTLVLDESQAQALGYATSAPQAWITLTVHSSLEAVGLTAAVATALAELGISCNVIAGYYHDHLFVAHARAEEALAALTRLSES